MNILKTVKRGGSRVKPLMKEVLKQETSKISSEMLLYHINTGGKRIRPFLAIRSCQLCGGDYEDVKWAAAALELLHNYTLIVDDIIDHGRIRRGQETVLVKFGKAMAECVHLHYAASIFEAANRSRFPNKTSRLVANALKIITEGEVEDILMEQGGRKSKCIQENRIQKIELEDYLQMVRKKTAELIKSSCKIGAISADTSEKEIRAMKEFGKNLGIAFQITDDYLDICGSQGKFGKKTGKDIKEQKLGNILILLALKELEEEEKRELRKILEKEKVREKDIKKAIKLIKSTKAPQKAKEMAKKYIEKGEKELRIFPNSEYKKELLGVANFLLEREI